MTIKGAHLKHILLLFHALILSGCFTVPQQRTYDGPPPRPASLEEYYPHKKSFEKFSDTVLGEKERYTIRRLQIEGDFTPIVIDYYQRPEPSESLILVFPVLGGRNVIAEYFARYFARAGFDTAIVHRNNDFKKPENFSRLEDILRQDVLRDRIALDFFEQRFHKKQFGSFGISRGGINVAITAGIDSRLKYNVIALGGTDLVELFRKTNQGRIGKYRQAVMAAQGITEEQFYEQLSAMVRTDPKNVAQYMDARNTLMFLGVFDHTVPFSSGEQLRAAIGDPRTVYLPTDHYFALLYTQFLKLLPPTREFTVLPFDFVERESLGFYRDSFTPNRPKRKLWFVAMLKAPFDAVGRVIHAALL